MNPSVLDTSSRFLQAAASYFGIPPDQLVMGVMSGAIDGVFKVQMTIALTPEDLAGVVNRMEQLSQADDMRETQDEPEVTFAPDIDIAKAREQYATLSPAEKGRYGSFGRFKAARQMEAADFGMGAILDSVERHGHTVVVRGDEPSEGIGGRKVQHVDAPEQEAESELPAAVWVESKDMNQSQYAVASDSRERDGVSGNEWLLQVALLTPEQRAKYAPEVKS